MQQMETLFSYMLKDLIWYDETALFKLTWKGILSKLNYFCTIIHFVVHSF